MREHISQHRVLPTRNLSRYSYDDVPDHLDILLFGPAGAGKTSLIKTFYRALHQTSAFPRHIESMLTVKDRHANEGTTQYTKVVIKPLTKSDSDERTAQEESKTQLAVQQMNDE